jgi:hypothetical protein
MGWERSTSIQVVLGNRTAKIEPPEEDPRGEACEPNQNGYVESFHGRLRDECLNREVF